MKTRTSTLLAAAIAAMALISVNASAEGPDHGRRGYDEGRHRNSVHADNRSHNNGHNPGHNTRPSDSYRPMPNDRITPSVGHNPGHNFGHNPSPNIGRERYSEHRPEYRPEPRPRHHARYRRPEPPRNFHRSPAFYRTARIFTDCLAAAAANAIVGAIVSNIPPYCTEVLIDGSVFYLADNILYRPVVISGRPYFEIASPYYY